MKTLYVSDLDGTLLRSNETTSDYTNAVINSLTDRGILFSYATARSLVTAKKVTRGMCARFPLIVYNGAFVMDNVTQEVLIANYFDDSIQPLLEDLFAHEVYPIVYSRLMGKEVFSFVPQLCTEGMNKFLATRHNDPRTHAVAGAEALRDGNIFYLTCIDEPEKLYPLYEKYKDQYHCVYQRDIYTGDQWLEIMPKAASKSNAISQLKKMLGCDKLVVFGDGRNDIDMFAAADEAYAVKNAHADLLPYATGIIPCNDEDGVAHWLQEHAE